jgi:syntaxin 1B/2/3
MADSTQGTTQNAEVNRTLTGAAVEMAPLTQNAGGMAREDPNAIRNECRDISNSVREVESNLEQIKVLQSRVLSDVDSSSSSQSNRQLDALTTETMAIYRSLAERVRTVKSKPEGRNAMNSGHVDRVDREVKAVITKYQTVESEFQAAVKQQMGRQYRIVRPDATEEEVQAAVDDTGNGQIFSQALMQSDRQGRARAALSAVQDRHKELLKIEQQMTELFQLMQDLDTLVVQQDETIVQIEQKGEEIVDNLDKGNEEIAVAVTTAKSTRKKKWICLGIVGKLNVYSAMMVGIRTNLYSCHYCHRRYHRRRLHLGQPKNKQQEAISARGICCAGCSSRGSYACGRCDCPSVWPNSKRKTSLTGCTTVVAAYDERLRRN